MLTVDIDPSNLSASTLLQQLNLLRRKQNLKSGSWSSQKSIRCSEGFIVAELHSTYIKFSLSTNEHSESGIVMNLYVQCIL